MKQVKDRYFYKIWALYIFLFSFGIHLNAKGRYLPEWKEYIRGKKETSGLEEREIDASCQVEQTKVGEQMDIYRGLSRLKEAERTCITLFFMEDLPIEKIAIVTGMPAGTVKSHLSRGKEKLSNFLKQNGYDGK